MEEESICLDCPKYKEAKDKILEESDSIFDAFVELNDFVEKCKLGCKKYNNPRYYA